MAFLAAALFLVLALLPGGGHDAPAAQGAEPTTVVPSSTRHGVAPVRTTHVTSSSAPAPASHPANRPVSHPASRASTINRATPHPTLSPTRAPAVTPALAAWHLEVPTSTGAAPIDKEGADGSGFIGIPQDVHRVGVYTGAGDLDGTVGDVVIVGHVNWVSQGAGYLGSIGRLHPGDRIVTRGAGLATTWRVTTVHMYVKATGLPQSLFRATGPRGLVLITCGGVLNAASGSYLSNVVVTAVPA